MEEAKKLILTATLSDEYSCHNQGYLSVVSFRLVSEETVMSVHMGTLYLDPGTRGFCSWTPGATARVEPRQWVGERVTEFMVRFPTRKRITFLVCLQGGTSQWKPTVSGRVCQGLKRTTSLWPRVSQPQHCHCLGLDRSVLQSSLRTAGCLAAASLSYPLDATTTP